MLSVVPTASHLDGAGRAGARRQLEVSQDSGTAPALPRCKGEHSEEAEEGSAQISREIMANRAIVCLRLPCFVARGEKEGATLRHEEVRWNFDHLSGAVCCAQLLPLEPSKLPPTGFLFHV